MLKALPENSDLQDIENGEPAFSITASDILEYLFCPRFTYFELYLKIPEHQEKRFKVQKGRTVHEDKMRVNPRGQDNWSTGSVRTTGSCLDGLLPKADFK